MSHIWRWYRCFLWFLELLKHQYHPEISEEVRRQIVRTEPRDDEMEEPPAHIMEEMMNAI